MVARRVDKCEVCGEPVPIGSWPYCASPANPDGHARGAAYAFKMAMSMKTNGWSRRER